MIGCSATINHADRDNIWYQRPVINARLSITSKGSTGDRCQLVQNKSSSTAVFVFAHTARWLFWWAGSIDNSAYSLSLSIPILQLSDILLREINFQCALASIAASRERQNVSQPQERVAAQKSWKILFCEFVTNLGQFRPCCVSSLNRAKPNFLKCRIAAVKALVQYLKI